MPKVTIVVPIFNGSGYIERNSRYILEQEHKDIEVIFVVDLRSTDDSLQKVKDMLSKYPHAVIVEQNEGGLGHARNLGIERATGDLIWFLDVDDRPMPRYLSTLVSQQEKHNADVAIGNCIMSKATDPAVRQSRNGIRVMNGHEAMTERGNNRIPVTAWSMVIRTDVIKKNDLRFIYEGYCEDIDFTYRLLSISNVIVFCEEPLYVYVQNPGSMCSNNNERGMAEIKNYMDLIDHMKENEPGFYREFHRIAAVTIVRSSTRLDKEHYMDFATDEKMKMTISKELSFKVNPELIFFKLFPRIYRMIARVYMELIFYREGKIF
jgi:glycosyltransferase involved in cell wall biosynthesis